MSKKVMIEVDEDALELLDGMLEMFYYKRRQIKLMMDKDDGDGWWEIDNHYDIVEDHKYYAFKSKLIAKAFGLYPYNQEEILFPDIKFT